jgi:hypothetical protein
MLPLLMMTTTMMTQKQQQQLQQLLQMRRPTKAPAAPQQQQQQESKEAALTSPRGSDHLEEKSMGTALSGGRARPSPWDLHADDDAEGDDSTPQQRATHPAAQRPYQRPLEAGE